MGFKCASNRCSIRANRSTFRHLHFKLKTTMDKYRVLLTLMMPAALILSSCSSNKALPDVETGDIPSWFTDKPTDSNYFFASATQTSRDMQAAMDRATQNARVQISQTVNAHVESITEDFTEEVGADASSQYLSYFMTASRTVTDNSLTGSQVVNSDVVRDGDMWRAYVLVQYPIGAANQALVDQLKQDEQLYTRFRAAEAFKKLDEQTRREYEESQRQP